MKTMATVPEKSIEVDIDDRQLVKLIYQKIFEIAKVDEEYDDAGCDWITKDGITYIANNEWVFSKDPNVAILVDACNIILYGKIIKLEEKKL